MKCSNVIVALVSLLSLGTGSISVSDASESQQQGIPSIRASTVSRDSVSLTIPRSLTSFSLARIDAADLSESLATMHRLSLHLDQKRLALLLEASTILSSGHDVVEVDSTGHLQHRKIGATCYRGTVEGESESSVRLTITENWVSGYVSIPGQWVFFEPAHWHDSSASRDLHVFYDTRDDASAFKYGDDCGHNFGDVPQTVLPDLSHLARLEGLRAATAKICADGDDAFHQLHPGDWANQQAAVLNNVEGLFYMALDVQFEIVGQRVYVSGGPQGDGPHPCNLLHDVEDDWYSADSEVEEYKRHAVAHFSGRQIVYGCASGVGHLGVCRGYFTFTNVPVGNFNASAYHKMIVATHELAHLFGGEHADAATEWCSQPSCGYECYTIMWYDFYGSCALDHFTQANIGNMEVVDDRLYDEIDPTASIAFQSNYTRFRDVVLLANGQDGGSGIAGFGMRDGGQEWNAWECGYVGIPSLISWELPAGDGLKVVYMRVQDEAANETITSDSIILDTVEPTCHIEINDDASYTDSRSVTLNLFSSDTGSGVDRMSFKNEGENWSSWYNYATMHPWTLSAGDGSKRVYARFRDNAGNESNSCSDTIVLDTVVPAPSWCNATDGTSCDWVQVTWENVSGEDGYRVYRNGSQVGSDRPAGSTSYNDTSADPGQSYTYYVRAFDKAVSHLLERIERRILWGAINPKRGVN